MKKAILIYNPKAVPYGPLSNNYNSYIKFREKDKRTVWKNVSEFIYSNLLNNKSSIKRVREKKPNYVKIFRKYYDLEKKKAVKQALQIAYEALLEKKSVDEEDSPRDVLLGIKEKKIVYSSKNGFWNKENMIGEILESLRKKIINQTEKEKIINEQNIMREDLYYLYIITKLLESNFEKLYTNLHLYRKSKDIKELLIAFTGKTEDKLYTELSKSIAKASFISRIKDVLKEGQESRFKKILLLLTAVNYENNFQRKVDLLINGILKFNIKVYLDEITRYRDNLIITTYLKHFFKQQMSDPNSEIYNMSGTELEKLKNDTENSFKYGSNRGKVIRLYKQRKLPPTLMTKITQLLEQHPLPSKSEITKINEFKIPHVQKEAVERIERVGTFVLSGDSPYDAKYKSLIPFVKQENFTVEKLKFPTIMHYVYYYLFKIFLKVEGEPLRLDPYDLIKSGINFESYPVIKRKFNEKTNEILKYKKKKFANKGVNIKFQRRELQDLLLSTGTHTLIWTDRSDRILGIGVDGTGNNLMGKILEKTRKRIKDERKTEPKIANIKPEDITELVNSNTIIKNWLKMKITDLCKLYSTINYYYIYLYGEELPKSKMCKKINSEAVLKSKRSKIVTESSILSILINTVYTPCSNIYHYKSEVESFPPLWFITYVKANKNFEKADIETTNVLWKHVIVLIFYMIKDSLRTETDLVDVIAKSSFYLRNKELNLCGDHDFGQNFSTKQNNILLAIFNCVKKLVKFKHEISRCLDKDIKFHLEPLLQTSKNLILGTPKVLEIVRDDAVDVIPFCEEEVCEDIKEQAFRLPSRHLLELAEKEGRKDRSRSRKLKMAGLRRGQSPRMQDIGNYIPDNDNDVFEDEFLREVLGLDEDGVEDDENVQVDDFSEHELYNVEKYIDKNFEDLDDIVKSNFAKEVVKTMSAIQDSKRFSHLRINFFC